MTLDDAVRKWIGEFDHIPQSLIIKAYGDNLYDEFVKLTEEDEYEEFLPMFDTMWRVSDSSDTDWLKKNLDTVRELGFMLFWCEDLGYVLGIDGVGYNFYEAHWTPLYLARGLQWHSADVA